MHEGMDLSLDHSSHTRAPLERDARSTGARRALRWSAHLELILSAKIISATLCPRLIMVVGITRSKVIKGFLLRDSYPF